MARKKGAASVSSATRAMPYPRHLAAGRPLPALRRRCRTADVTRTRGRVAVAAPPAHAAGCALLPSAVRTAAQRRAAATSAAGTRRCCAAAAAAPGMRQCCAGDSAAGTLLMSSLSSSGTELITRPCSLARCSTQMKQRCTAGEQWNEEERVRQRSKASSRWQAGERQARDGRWRNPQRAARQQAAAMRLLPIPTHPRDPPAGRHRCAPAPSTARPAHTPQGSVGHRAVNTAGAEWQDVGSDEGEAPTPRCLPPASPSRQPPAPDEPCQASPPSTAASLHHRRLHLRTTTNVPSTPPPTHPPTWNCSTASGLGGPPGVAWMPRHMSSLSDRTSTCGP